ncbi:beta-ketoacyl-ACP synthase [Lyngbya confervoides]|uniref:Beta-ketoacyl-ACP synthase n=1 Tax=Lyngbya confervoides BDU141951 TaxID=1574623 RepID=A0ABD4T0A0_9CYAN|nr:beta-ketoacyl-ACP synthase [Lyngbya confervoides]MCM1981732.1 beta-ketoacyl-ACP synthase [Lyngbya confervoides BDU141951]
MTTTVVVTGMGLSTALGDHCQATWSGLLAGKTGLVSHKPFADLPATVMGLVHPPAPAGLSELLLPVVEAALADAGWTTLPAAEVGIVMGSSRGTQRELELEAQRPQTNWIDLVGESPSVQVARHLSVCGPILAPRAACATGLWAIAQGADLIRHDHCKVALVGGAEAPITPLTLAGFRKMGALSAEAARPFDQNRSGFSLAEGSACLVLESLVHAQQRQARIYGTVLGFGATADAYHVSAPNPRPLAALIAIRQCLARSSLAPHQVDFIHAHGTGTRLNDAGEAAMIAQLFPHRPFVTSSKGATGHTLGASGAMGSVLCLLALRHQRVPPCTGLTQRDAAFEIELPFQAVSAPLQHALCLSFGFGGQNAAIAFTRSGER